MISYPVFGFIIYHQSIKHLHKPYQCLLVILMKSQNEGITYNITKTCETDSPKNYRPITCLVTTYKLITSSLINCTYSFLEENSILSLEQNGCRWGSYFCKGQQLINKINLEIAGKDINISAEHG